MPMEKNYGAHSSCISTACGMQVQVSGLWQNIQKASRQVWKTSAHTFPNYPFLEEGLYLLHELVISLSKSVVPEKPQLPWVSFVYFSPCMLMEVL